MNSTKPEYTDKWDLVISPKTRLFDLKLNDVWKYRDLLLLFVKRDFVAQYKQTILGSVMACYTASIHRYHFFACFWKDSQDSDRWYSAHSFLYEWNHDLELFYRMPYQHL